MWETFAHGMALPRVYICDENPRMRQMIADRLEGHAEVVGEGGTRRRRRWPSPELEPDMVVLDYRTTIGDLEETVASIKDRHPSTAVVVHTGVPRYLIQDQVAGRRRGLLPEERARAHVALVHAASSLR